MNNIDIIGIGDKRSSRTEHKTKFDSLKDYLIIARKTIAAYAPGIRQGLAEEMLRNEDAVANIAYTIMLADWDYDGRGSRFGFRKARIKWAIRSYVGRSSKRSKNSAISIDVNYGNDPENGSFADLLEDSGMSVEKQVIQKEIVEKVNSVLSEGVVSDKGLEYIKMYYMEGKTMPQIAEANGVSRQSVHSLIQSSIKKLSDRMINDNFFRGIIYED